MTEQDTALALIREVDRRDDEQIIVELGGGQVEEFYYSFTDSLGRKQEGMSWAGFREMAWHRGNLQLGQPQITEGVDENGRAYWRVMTSVTDLERNLTLWAGTHQPKEYARRDTGELVEDAFAYEKGISKAQRNALKNIIPVSVVRQAIEIFKLPPAERAKALQAQSKRRLPAAAPPQRETARPSPLPAADRDDQRQPGPSQPQGEPGPIDTLDTLRRAALATYRMNAEDLAAFFGGELPKSGFQAAWAKLVAAQAKHPRASA